MTDDFTAYRNLGLHFKHKKVKHSHKEYARGEAHVNTAEGYFSLLKRGINGTFHHVGKQHLNRYLKEFDFRWNQRHISDTERFVKLIEQVAGKRLAYCKPKPS
jgi:ISXO2 transposase-like protein